MDQAVARLDWPQLTAELDREGYAVLPQWLGADDARALARQLVARRPPESRDAQGLFSPPAPQPVPAWNLPDLPPPLDDGCARLYARLRLIAQRWADAMGRAAAYPPDLNAGQLRLTASCLGTGGEQPLHHASIDAQGFPLQLVLLLSEPGEDFSGGEFVMTEQRPRQQSRPIVVPLRRGDAALITVAQRPVSGRLGHHRVTMKQAVSRVRSGERVALSLLFPALGCAPV